MTDAQTSRAIILGAVARLTTQQRAVICRSYYDAWKTAQIADDLNTDVGTVISYLHDGLRALRLFVQECGPTGIERSSG